MATIKFTSNADSGAGSLRQAIANATSGDTITPDPNVFSAGSLITISLASRIEINGKSLTLDAGACRVRLDGQETVSCAYFRNAVVSLTGFDVVRGYASNNGAGVSTAGTNGTETSITFDRCLFAGNRAYNAGGAVYAGSYVTVNLADCAIVGNFANKGALDWSGSTATINITRSTLMGNYSEEKTTGYRSIRISYANGTTTDSLIDGTFSSDAPVLVNSFNNVAVSNFVAVPAFTSLDDWSADLWEDWDLHLVPKSQYASGATTSGTVDLAGNARRPGGALGAYEVEFVGTVVNHAFVVDSDTALAWTTTVDATTAIWVKEKYLGMSKNMRLGETPIFFARLENSETGECLQTSDIESATYTVYKYDVSSIRTGGSGKTPVQNWQNLPLVVEDVFFDEPIDEDRRVDFAYNFRFEPDATLVTPFATAGNYSIEFAIAPVNGNKVPVIYECSFN